MGKRTKMRRGGRALEMREMRTGAEYHRASQREPSPGGGESAPRRAGGEWVGEAGRCKRCGAYFATRKQAKSAHCVFHKGKYASPGGNWRPCLRTHARTRAPSRRLIGPGRTQYSTCFPQA